MVGLQSDELKARLEKLRETQERKEYAELVRDVAPPSKDDAPEPFSSYKDQIGFGTTQPPYFQIALCNLPTACFMDYTCSIEVIGI